MLLFYRKFQSSFCIYSVIFCTKLAELRTFARTDSVWGNVYWVFMSMKLHFSVGPLWMGSPPWSVQPFGHNTPTLQTGQDRQDRQRSDSIGRTVLQTVARKLCAGKMCTALTSNDISKQERNTARVYTDKFLWSYIMCKQFYWLIFHIQYRIICDLRLHVTTVC